MSSASPTGAIQLTGELDLSQAYAALARFRQDAAKVGIGGNASSATPAASLPGANAAVSAAQFAMTSTNNPTFQGIASGNIFAAPFAVPTGIQSQQANQSTQQIGQAASQLAQAVAQLSHILGTFTINAQSASAQAVGGGAGASTTALAAAATVGGGTGVTGLRFPLRPGTLVRGIGASIGGMGGMAAGMALYSGSQEVMRQLNNQHELQMIQMGGGTGFDVRRAELSQLESLRSGGVMGLNSAFAAGGEWLADHASLFTGTPLAYNPGGVLTRIRDREKDLTDQIKLEQKQKQHWTSLTQEREMNQAIAEAGEPNQWARQRIQIQHGISNQIASISTRYTEEQAHLEHGSQEWLQSNADELAEIKKAHELENAQLGAAMREERHTYAVQSVQSSAAYKASNYRMRGQGRFAIMEENQAQLDIFESEKSRRYDLENDSGRKAAQDESDNIRQEGYERLRRFDLSLQANKTSLAISTGSLNIMAGRSQFGVRPAGELSLLGRINDIAGQTLEQQISAMASGQSELLPAIGQKGQASLRALKHEFFSRISTEDVNPFTQALTGPGTSNQSEVMRQLNEEIQKLGQVPSTLTEIRDLLKKVNIGA